MRDRLALSINQAAWNAQAILALTDDQPQSPKSSLEWTQFPGHGPGIALLGNVAGKRVVELGCGNGDNTAALATAGAVCTGLDIAPVQLQRARRRWPHLPVDWYLSDACSYLAAPGPRFDIVVSIFGAIGLCAPHPLLDLVGRRLTPGGTLAFSVPDPDWLGARRDHLSHSDGTASPVARWNLTGQQWKRELSTTGFVVRDQYDVAQPDGQQASCMIFVARKA